MKIAAAYIRVSTDDQLEYSPASQLEKIKEFAKSHNYILTDDFIFVDEGISGRNVSKRPEFNRMISLAKSKPTPFETILVWKFSRFARNREDSIVYKSMLKKQCGISVVSVSEPVGDDKMSVLIEAMIEAMDEYYSINLAEEVKRGMTQKIKEGGIVSVAPYGYKIVDGKLEIVPDQAIFIKNIFDDFLDGMSYLAITKKYSNMGLKTRYGNSPDKRFFDYLLQNPVYCGKVRWSPDGNGASKRNFTNSSIITADGKHQPIISEETFYKAQERVRKIKELYPKHQRSSQPFQYMLKGLVRCGTCGATLVNTGSGLNCHNYTRGTCHTSHYISMNKIEKFVIEELKRQIALNKFNIAMQKNEPNSESIDIFMLIEKEKAKLLRVKNAYADGIDSLDEYKNNKTKIQNNIIALEKELKKRTKPKKQLSNEDYKEKIMGVLAIIETPNETPSTKNMALRSVIKSIILHRSAGIPDRLEVILK